MKTVEWASAEEHSNQRILISSAILALVLEISAIFILSQNYSFSPAGPQKNEQTEYIEAQVFEAPPVPRLVDNQKKAHPQAQKEVSLSKNPNQGVSQTQNAFSDQQNITQSGPELPPSHKPIVIYSPSPVIPSYLLDKDLKTFVIIAFQVDEQGNAEPRLAGSSGNEELDAIALAAAKKWQFRPAERDHQPIADVIKLKMIFEVQ